MGSKSTGTGAVGEDVDAAVAARKQVAADLLNGVQLDDCLKLLGAGTDEEKFAGLLLVTKVVQPDDASALKKVMRAVSMRFLYRLVSSPGSPAGAHMGNIMSVKM